MTDRELIELAAKAAGIDGCATQPFCGLNVAGEGLWNPLESDADAFRLAVGLGIDVITYPFYEPDKHSVVCERTYEMFRGGKIEVLQAYGDDPLAATRRAITMAAAEIAKERFK